MFGDTTADADGVADGVRDRFRYEVESVGARSRSLAWRCILLTAERSSGEDGVQSGARRRVAAVNS